MKGVPITNKSTGIVAQFGNEGIKKFVSDKAINKSLKNGYTEKQHYEAAELVLTRPDRDKDSNIKDVKYFDCATNVLGEDAVASIMVKNILQHGHHIYKIELQELNKPAELKTRNGTESSAGSKGSTQTSPSTVSRSSEEPSVESIQ